MNLSYDVIYLIHILFVAPLLMYSGHTGYNNCSKKHDQGIFLLLGAIGFVVLSYHGFLYYKLKMI